MIDDDIALDTRTYSRNPYGMAFYVLYMLSILVQYWCAVCMNCLGDCFFNIGHSAVSLPAIRGGNI